MKERVAALVRARSPWTSGARSMEGSDVCFAPVLTMAEAARHPHNVARSTYVEVAGISQPAPAPRFEPHRRRPCQAAAGLRPAQHTDDVLASSSASTPTTSPSCGPPARCA